MGMLALVGAALLALTLLLPAHGIFAGDDPSSLYRCKDSESDWPLPCRAPGNDVSNYKFAGSFPVTAWWGPVGYGGGKEAAEFGSYVEANFVSRRNRHGRSRSPRCPGPEQPLTEPSRCCSR